LNIHFSFIVFQIGKGCDKKIISRP